MLSLFVSEGEVEWGSPEDREAWEEEQKRLDREWYGMDDGVAEENNPFSNLSEEYVKKKELQLEQRKKKRMSAQQRQISKVCSPCCVFFFHSVVHMASAVKI